MYAHIHTYTHMCMSSRDRQKDYSVRPKHWHFGKPSHRISREENPFRDDPSSMGWQRFVGSSSCQVYFRKRNTICLGLVFKRDLTN